MPSTRPRGSCAIEECGRPHYGHGLCQRHYHRWRTWGDPYFIAQRVRAPTPHGTRTGYTHQRCRCELCRAANREFQRRWMRERYQADPEVRRRQIARTVAYKRTRYRTDEAHREREKASVRERYRRKQVA